MGDILALATVGKREFFGSGTRLYCLSLWFALPVALYYAPTWFEAGLYWLAFSGGAIVIERVSAPKPIVYEIPSQGGYDDMLRQESSMATDHNRHND